MKAPHVFLHTRSAAVLVLVLLLSSVPVHAASQPAQARMEYAGGQVTAGIPVPVGGLYGVVSIATGSMHSLALTRDGSVWAWGANTYGQLGTNATADSRRPV